MNVIRFILQNHEQVLDLTLEHLWLVGVSTLFAVLIGIPTGDRDCSPATAEQAGTGKRKHHSNDSEPRPLRISVARSVAGRTCGPLAILALTLYALLPIIRNTYTGIRGVDPAVVEAGRGMGLTESQLLFQV